MKRCKVFVFMLALMLPAVCGAENIGDKGYYAVVLERRNAIQDRSIDALVFTKAGSTYRFIRRLDEDYRLVLNAASGNEAPAVTAANSAVYEAMIKRNRLTPRTIRDRSGRELAIVYCGLNPCSIDRDTRQDGSILLDVKGGAYFNDEIFGVFDRQAAKD